MIREEKDSEISASLVKSIDDILHPRSIAVIGASENPASFGYHYLRYLIDYGYQGKIYPVTPKQTEVLGHKAYHTITEIQGDVDYVICCVNASSVKDLLYQSLKKRVKAIHLFTGRLSETGESDAIKLEEEITEEARKLRIRLIGPNSMGLYYPRERISFNYDLPLEPGPVGAIIQSGGIAGELVRHAALKGVRFSKVISYGNASDLNESDFLEYFLWDEETRIVALYIEGVRDGRRFFNLLRQLTFRKPVIILKGGRSTAGFRAIASHTASLAGSTDIWERVFRQSKVIHASSFDEFVDLTTAFCFIPPLTGKRVGIVGGGGGKSVLAADAGEEKGLQIIPIPDRIKKFLEEKSPTLAKWLGNPVDFSILMGFSINPFDLLKLMVEDPAFDFLIATVTDDSPLNDRYWVGMIEREVETYLAIARQKLKPIVAIIGNAEVGMEQVNNWRWEALFKLRERLVKEGIPVFSTIGRAASAINKLVNYYQAVSNR